MFDVIGSIVAYNPEIQALHKAIESFLNSRLNSCIVVWDNSPEDHISADLATHFGEKVKYLKSPSNLGYGSGHNSVFDLFKNETRFFCILNPDVIISENGLNTLVEYLGSHQKFGMISAAICDSSGKLVPAHKTLPTFFEYLYFFFRKKFFSPNEGINDSSFFKIAKTETIQLPVMSGCFMLFKTEHFEELGGFDSSFFLYFEDWDISLRSFLQHKAVILTTVKITHLWSRHSHFKLKPLLIHIRSAITFYSKWGFGNKTAKKVNSAAGPV